MSAQDSATQALIVAIDGPAGVGKSTAARLLARRLGVPYLDTGAMYRAVALEALTAGLPLDDRAQVEELAARLDLAVERTVDTDGVVGLAVLVAGQPVEGRIRTPEVSAATSKIAVYPGVRRRLVELQQQAGRKFGGVVEGRDIGTRVFPEARVKFFFEAAPEVRAERRYQELQGSGRAVSLSEVQAEIESRDRRDQGRTDSPLQRAEGAVVVDTSARSAEQVVAEMLALVRSRA